MRRTVLVLLLALLSGVAPAGAAEAPAVTLRPAVTVDRPTVRLGDVFEGVPEATDRVLASAPAPGRSISWDSVVLERVARQHGLDWRPVSPEAKVTLTRAATRVTTDKIREAALAKVRESMPLTATDEPEVALDQRGLEIVVPGTLAPDVSFRRFDLDRTSRRFRAELVAGDAAPVIVTGRVTLQKRVPVLAQRLDKGVKIGEQDLQWTLVPEERVTGDVIADARKLAGLELRHAVNEGQPLRGSDLIRPRLVTRGALVTLKVEAPGLLVTAQGRALDDGAEGDTVRVINTQSNRSLEGAVEGTGVVRVRIAPSSAVSSASAG